MRCEGGGGGGDSPTPSGPLYLRASTHSDTTAFTGSAEATGSAFRFEKCSQNEFQISFLDEDSPSTSCKPHFLTTSKDPPDSGSCPIELGGKHAIACRLEHPSEGDIGTDIGTWTKEACYVKITQPQAGYLGYDAGAGSVVLVAGGRRKGESGKLHLRFRAERVEEGRESLLAERLQCLAGRKGETEASFTFY